MMPSGSTSARKGESPTAARRGSSSRWRWILSALIVVAAATVSVGAALVAYAAGLGGFASLSVALALGSGFLLMWLAYRLLLRLLFRVGRRLAFSYFLIGVLPIPMVVFLLAVGAYLLSGFFLGHLFREASALVYERVLAAADTKLLDPGRFSNGPSADLSEVAFGYYFDGRRIGGDARAPAEWPVWIEEAVQMAEQGFDAHSSLPSLVVLPDHTLSIAVARRSGDFGVVAFYDGHLETALRDESGVWVDLLRPEDFEAENVMDVTILGERFVFQPLSREKAAEDRAQFLNRGGYDPAFWIHGFDDAGSVLFLDSGEALAENTPAALIGTPRLVLGELLSASREVDTLAWLTFVVPAFLLFDIFAVAWIMAVFMIFGLSRAVNRLSRATSAVQQGDFSHRIPVRRRDQLGALHGSFNEMAAGLEDLIRTRAQKETLETELEIARELQKSLIPSEVVPGDEAEFATYFEPSAAIGGDYFDILRLDHRRLAVVIADVSGHGLSAGLRMAMLKAALTILVEEEDDPEVILRRLDRMVRSSDEGPSFVTATLALVDLESGVLDLVNAGHPPTYIVRGGEVREVVLPGAPLGALGDQYGSARIELHRGDSVVWLSDGFIEALNDDEELFGYERTVASLAGESETPSEVRDRLLAKVGHHTRGRPADDDRTLVVMRYCAGETAVLPRPAAVGS
jgi:serine phosphatase RsbU (regulator of sigma subunit)